MPATVRHGHPPTSASVLDRDGADLSPGTGGTSDGTDPHGRSRVEDDLTFQVRAGRRAAGRRLWHDAQLRLASFEDATISTRSCGLGMDADLAFSAHALTSGV